MQPVPALARYLTFGLVGGARREEIPARLATLEVDESRVFGIAMTVVAMLDGSVPGLRSAPHIVGRGVEMPSTLGALWVWLKGDDRGDLLHAGREIEESVSGAFELVEVTDAFRYRSGLDLTGYEDGTENPTGERAAEVAFVSGVGAGLDGSSFVAVQKWVHRLATFHAMPADMQDASIGRRISDNEEIDDAPASAHVKRTAQESFDPEAFVLRRSMPWADASGEGLVFVAFGATFDPFEALARRMVGLEDGIVDALFGFTHPTTGSYYWCPPVTDGHLDLRALRSR
jgi:putative iron-dependent peroxidase